jgi:tetratricopeptide (TPR) repeat protein
VFVDEGLLARFFPPPLRFASDADLVIHKSRLLVEAQWLGNVPFAAVLFQQAGALEEYLADQAASPPTPHDGAAGPARSNHLISAATCYVYSGDIQAADRILALPGVVVPPSARSFFARLAEHKRTWKAHVATFRSVYARPTWESAEAIVSPNLFGRVPVRVLLWLTYRAANVEGRRVEARKALRCLIVAHPQDVHLHIFYVSHFLDSATEVALYSRELVAAFPLELATHAMLLYGLVREGKFPEAIVASEHALDKVRGSLADAEAASAIYAGTSIALRRFGRLTDATKILAEALIRLPTDPELRALYALTLFTSGHEDAAEIEASEAARQVDQNDDKFRVRSPWPHTVAGRIALHRGAFEIAVGFLARAVTLPSPVRARTYNDLGVAHANLGDLTAAESALREAARIDPNYTLPNSNLSRLTMRQPTQRDINDLDMELDYFIAGCVQHSGSEVDRRSAA